VYRNLPNWMEEPARAPVRSIGYVHPSTATLDATKDPEQAATELVGSRGANVMLDVLDGGTRSGAPASPAKMTLRFQRQADGPDGRVGVPKLSGRSNDHRANRNNAQ